MTTRVQIRLVALVTLVVAFAAPAAASARRNAAPAKPTAKPAAAPAPAAKPAAAPATTAAKPGTATPAAPPPAGGTQPAPTSAPLDGDTEVTRYTFTGLDIDGELRTPALLQFLARIGGEFETVGIPHRSFMPELSFTVSEDSL